MNIQYRDIYILVLIKKNTFASIKRDSPMNIQYRDIYFSFKLKNTFASIKKGFSFSEYPI